MSIQPTFESIADVEAQAQRMRAYFQTGATLPVEHRRQALRQLKAYLKANEERVLEALAEDLGKAPFEGYATELGIVYDEINLCLKHLGRWAKPRRVRTPIVHFHSTSKVYASPLGVALVLSPWNYPVQLALVPLVDAIAAGNCVALKPSRTSIATSKLLMEMTASLFPPEFVCGFPGSAEMNDWLLDVRWDKLFFTGSPSVGHRVMQAGARYLTRVTLELGGKSPASSTRPPTSSGPRSASPGARASTRARPAWRPTTSSCTSAWRTNWSPSWTHASTSTTARTSCPATNGRT